MRRAVAASLMWPMLRYLLHVVTPPQALDPRTRMVLFKMLNRGLFSDINGCISTGKEANVYHAVDGAGNDLAVKIYKTSILVFKDRDRYSWLVS